MRVSVREDDPGYSPNSWAHRIFVDGEEVTATCHTADEEEGIVRGYRKNEAGESYLDESTGMPAEYVMFGEVVITRQANGVDVNA